MAAVIRDLMMMPSSYLRQVRVKFHGDPPSASRVHCSEIQAA